MSRPLRIEYPGAWYHVMNRGRRREDIFLSRHDYEAFVKVLQEAAAGWNLKISAYCLMPNHYHLLVHTPDGNIARCMRHINGVYTQRFNRSHQTDGQLFRGRYKAVLIEGDSHLLEVLRYIHKNPLRAGLVKSLVGYPWSSHHGYLSSGKEWEWLYKDFLLAMLSDTKSKTRSVYSEFVSQDEPEEVQRFYSRKNLPSVLGGDSFKECIKKKFKHLMFQEETPQSRSLALTASEVISTVCDHFEVKKTDIAFSKRGTENLPRDVAIYFVRHYCRETLASVGRHFAISNYSTVSSAVLRIKVRQKEDQVLQGHLGAIAAKLNESQEQT